MVGDISMLTAAAFSHTALLVIRERCLKFGHSSKPEGCPKAEYGVRGHRTSDVRQLLTKHVVSVVSDLRLLAISAQITEVSYSIGELQTRIFGTVVYFCCLNSQT